MIIAMTISIGLRRKRRISRSMMAKTRFMSRPPDHERTVLRRGFLQRVAKCPPCVVHEDIIECGALNSERVHADADELGLLHERQRGHRTVGRRDAEDRL